MRPKRQCPPGISPWEKGRPPFVNVKLRNEATKSMKNKASSFGRPARRGRNGNISRQDTQGFRESDLIESVCQILFFRRRVAWTMPQPPENQCGFQPGGMACHLSHRLFSSESNSACSTSFSPRLLKRGSLSPRPLALRSLRTYIGIQSEIALHSAWVQNASAESNILPGTGLRKAFAAKLPMTLRLLMSDWRGRIYG
jgi:hypothetical protein